jgi:hypothetical protein
MKRATTEDFKKEMWMHAWILLVVGIIMVVLYLSAVGYLLKL